MATKKGVGIKVRIPGFMRESKGLKLERKIVIRNREKKKGQKKIMNSQSLMCHA